MTNVENTFFCRDNTSPYLHFQVDVVVFATGYNYSFPFLPPELQNKRGFRLRLFKHIFPPALSHPTLAVVGFIHAFGAINTLAEMQGRWATRVIKGEKAHDKLKVSRYKVSNLALFYPTSYLYKIQPKEG